MEMYSNSVGCGDAACDYGVGFNDIATNYDNAMNSINTAMPNPGNGSNVSGDTPQEVLFFVTDGVEDEQNGGRLIQPINYGTSHNYCNDIKARGIRIAVLYTEYLPVPANSFYVSMSSRYSPISDLRCKPVRRRICSTTRRSARPRSRLDHAVRGRRQQRHAHQLK